MTQSSQIEYQLIHFESNYSLQIIVIQYFMAYKIYHRAYSTFHLFSTFECNHTNILKTFIIAFLLLHFDDNAWIFLFYKSRCSILPLEPHQLCQSKLASVSWKIIAFTRRLFTVNFSRFSGRRRVPKDLTNWAHYCVADILHASVTRCQ